MQTPRKRPISVLLLSILLALGMAACSEKMADGGHSMPEEAAANVPAADAPAAKSAEVRSKFLAYAHAIRLDVEESKIAAVYEGVQAVCRQAKADQCVIIESRLDTGREVSAEILFRAKAIGVQKLLASLASKGSVVNQSVSSTDLAMPIADATKKLSMLNAYRSKLEELRGRADIDIDGLIKVNKELTQVQSEIEAMTGERTHLMLRVETETLRVTIAAIERTSFWKPVGFALSNFARHFSEGVSSAITGIAYLVPWGAVMLTFLWIARKLWLRKRKPST